MADAPALPTSPLRLAQDFYELRRTGIGHIEQAGSAAWTDYNTHDPGITVLEALAYALTDLAYRTDFPIEDILASAAPGAGSDDPYPGQAFYSARTVLTVNPVTSLDLRRLLIDVDPVRNAWLRCKACTCDTVFYAWCDFGELRLGFDPSSRKDASAIPKQVEVRGLYDVLLELEADPNFGDLNDRKVVRRVTWADMDGLHTVTIEVRFPSWALDRRDVRNRLAGDDQPFHLVTASNLTRTKNTNASTDDATLQRHWADAFYVDFELELSDHTKIAIDNASVRFFGDGATRRLATVANVLAALSETTEEGFADPYRYKLAAADRAVVIAKAVLEAHRNLDEDFCHVDLVELDDIAVCADIEVDPSADIELVQAKVWFEIEQYLDPPVAFYSLDELVAQGEPIESVFDGPELTNGFLTSDGLRDTELRTDLRVSDILNRLIDIDGVVAVANLQLTGYDAEGQTIKGKADPDWDKDPPAFDPNRISASWLLSLEPSHRPRLHRRLSRFLFSSNGLPFLPRIDEAEETLVQLHGEAARPKVRAGDLDLAWPMGRSREMGDYFPVQYSFPLVYGVGPHGLATTVTPLRRAQAKQLKAYLMVFEQLLRNAFAQVAHAGALFSLDATTKHTYFSALFDNSIIKGYDDIVVGLGAADLERLVETEDEFQARRNRFLDHLMARFGEQFGEYAGMLTDLAGQRTASSLLIDDKISYLRAFPAISHDRGKAFNRSIAPCDPDNTPGLQRRVNLLLGLPDLVFAYRAQGAGASHTQALTIDDRDGPVLTFSVPAAVDAALINLQSALGLAVSGDPWRIESIDGQLLLTISDATGAVQREETLLGRAAIPSAHALAAVLVNVQRDLLTALMVVTRFQAASDAGGHFWQIIDGQGTVIGSNPASERFPTKRAASPFVELISTWSAHKRAIVVEHLLLRPKFPGDALLPACSDGPCCTCDSEDPHYSFRITYVMPGWTSPFNTNMSWRAFAERTILEQTPAHLLPKICWVGNDGFEPDPCDPMIDALAAVLHDKARTTSGTVLEIDQACACAAAVLESYSTAFSDWYADKTLQHHQPGLLREALRILFDAVDLTGIDCVATIDPAVREEMQAPLVEHFVEIALRGYQFERFEDLWCRWVDADAAIDWTNERLQDTVIAILAAGLHSDGAPPASVCSCAATILATVGRDFGEWLAAEINAGTALDDLPEFTPSTVVLCPDLKAKPGFKSGVASAITSLLTERYATYTEVSYYLRLLVEALGELRNTYPRATLHDCDEGSDFNPVRLGQTALGSN